MIKKHIKYISLGVRLGHVVGTRFEPHHNLFTALGKHFINKLHLDVADKLAEKYLPLGACGVISFGVKGGREAAVKFMDSLKLAAIVVHVADARTSVLHPASTTHRQLTDEQLVDAGITPDLIRLSVGIENADDIIADIEQALILSQK